MVTLFSLYAPPGGNWPFYRRLFDMMSTEYQLVSTCEGDMNVRLSKMDSFGSSQGHSRPVINKVHPIIEECGVDVWRDRYSTSCDYTYFSALLFFLHLKETGSEFCHAILEQLLCLIAHQ